MKLLLQNNIASHYREAIYHLIDEKVGCDFCFGDKFDGIKKLDYSTFKGKVTELHNVFFPGGYYQRGFLRMLCKGYDTYIVCAETRCVSIWLFLILKKLFYPKKRVYTWGHGMLGKEGKRKQKFYRFMYRMLTGAFIYNERSVELMKAAGIPANKLYTIYNSLDYDSQLPIRQSLIESSIFQDYFSNNNKNIVFIGRLTKVKRFDILIDAVASLKEKGEYVNVTLIGDGDEKDSMEQKIRELGIQNQIWFYGACYDEKRNAELIFNADVCVSPGNIGLTAIHALMFGCPAITNDDFNHQMPEFETIKEGITGSFFHTGDYKSLANTIHNWFSLHSDDRERVRKSCYEEIDNKWNPHNQIRIIKEVLESNIR